jgi:hypothetical protein
LRPESKKWLNLSFAAPSKGAKTNVLPSTGATLNSS